jgi:hypothetical protein
MTAQTVVRKAALAASMLAPEAVERLLASLQPDLADRLRAAVTEVRRHGWDRRDLVDGALSDQAASTSPVSESAPAHLETLARRLDSASYARVLAAHEMDQQDFQLSLLEPDFATEVGQHLAAVPALPERLRAATLAAAVVLGSSATDEAD